MKELLIDLRQKRQNYRAMIEFCCDNLVLNNTIVDNGTFWFEPYCGEEYDEESGVYIDIYQYYIISERDAERLSTYTNEIVIYNDDLDIYLLCVTHYGTSWDYVPSNWKDVE